MSHQKTIAVSCCLLLALAVTIVGAHPNDIANVPYPHEFKFLVALGRARALHGENDLAARTTSDLSKEELKSRNFLYVCFGASLMVGLTCLAGGVFMWVKMKKKWAKEEAEKAALEEQLKAEKARKEAIEKEKQAAKDRDWTEQNVGEDSQPLLQATTAGKGLGALDEEEFDDEQLTPGQKEEALAKWAQQNAEEMRAKHEAYLKRRWWVLVALFVAMVVAATGIPLQHAKEATCSRGFFWETHFQFGAVFLATKMVELWLCATDPTLDLDFGIIQFSLKFFPSILGYTDAYLDASGMVIANACGTPLSQQLAWCMLGTYLLGVVVMQWILLGFSAARDPSQACLLKIVHMDLLASCVTLPEDQKKLWDRLHYIRTFGEDIPQAIFQIIYVVFVKENLFMLISIFMGLMSSGKALHDALSRALISAGAAEDFEKREQMYEIYSGSQDCTIRCWDVRSGECVREINAGSPANTIGVSGTRIVSAHDDGLLREWSRETGELIRTFEHIGWGEVFLTSNMMYSYYGNLRQTEASVKVWNLSSGDCERVFEAGCEYVRVLYVHGQRLYTVAPQTTEKVAEYCLGTGDLLHVYEGHTGRLNSLFATSSRLLSGSGDGTVREWSLATKTCTRVFDDHDSSFRVGLCVVTEYVYHASGSVYGGFHERSLISGEKLRTFAGHEGSIFTISLLQATGNLYTCSTDGTIREWDAVTGECKHTFEGHTAGVNDLKVQPRD